MFKPFRINEAAKTAKIKSIAAVPSGWQLEAVLKKLTNSQVAHEGAHQGARDFRSNPFGIIKELKSLKRLTILHRMV